MLIRMALKGLESFSMPLDKISRNSAVIIRHLAKEFPSERLGNGRNGVHDIRRHKWFQVCCQTCPLTRVLLITTSLNRASIGMALRRER